eukprot:SAG22_NODE_180_length_16069_cov_5.323231_3_plen_114_part_00
MEGANWTQADIHPWTSADASDPTWPYNDKLPAQLYTLDGTVYESLTVGLFSLFRGFVDGNARSTGSRTSAEWDEIYLGFSRDSFHWCVRVRGCSSEWTGFHQSVAAVGCGRPL